VKFQPKESRRQAATRGEEQSQEIIMSELATAVYDVEKAVERVEAAVKNK
jgi:hypothetical protein